MDVTEVWANLVESGVLVEPRAHPRHLANPGRWAPRSSERAYYGLIMTLDEICRNARELSARQGWNQTDPAHRMMFVTSEIGEVADAVVSVKEALRAGSDATAARQALGTEIFDAIWNLCALANALDVDLTTAARNKMTINDSRIWSTGEPASGE